MSAPKRAGDRGERAVAAFLERRGYTLLDRQWRCRQGELDLVALDGGGTLCFVEVKLRKDGRVAQAREFVDRRKQEKLRTTAQLYLAEHPTQLQPRFDIACVEMQGTHVLSVDYLENAFDATGSDFIF